MESDKFTKLFNECTKDAPISVGVVAPESLNVLEAIAEATNQNIIRPTLIGDLNKISSLAQDLNFGIENHNKFAANTHEEAAKIAVEIALEKKVQVLMKGDLHTDIFMHSIVNAEKLRTKKRMSHVMLLDIPTYFKPLVITDVALNICPKLEEKKAIIQNAVDFAIKIGLAEKPKVAILSAIETPTPKIPNTLDCILLKEMSEQDEIKNAILDGPLSFDLAFDNEAIRLKKFQSKVAGSPDIVVVPNLEAGNILVKSLEYFSHAKGYGLIVGASIPLILTSRASKKEERIGSLKLAKFLCR